MEMVKGYLGGPPAARVALVCEPMLAWLLWRWCHEVARVRPDACALCWLKTSGAAQVAKMLANWKGASSNAPIGTHGRNPGATGGILSRQVAAKLSD